MSYSLENVSVMVADDNAYIRRLVRTILEGFDCRHIVECANGEEAMRQLSLGAEPDLVIADWAMGPTDGLELTAELRDEASSPMPFVPIILLTAHSELHRVIRARDAGVNEILVKPVSAERLYRRIASLIDQPRPFIRTPSYFGPSRRGEDMPFAGPDRRGASPTSESQAEAAPGSESGAGSEGKADGDDYHYID